MGSGLKNAGVHGGFRADFQQGRLCLQAPFGPGLGVCYEHGLYDIAQSEYYIAITHAQSPGCNREGSPHRQAP